MKKKSVLLLSLILLVGLLSGYGCTSKEIEKTDVFSAYYNAIDTEYAMGVIEALTAFGSNSDLGFCTSGSFAEIAASDYLLGEMQEIGLKNVRKEQVIVDTWTFTNAELIYIDPSGQEQKIVMAAFATQYEAEREEVQLVYAGRGTEADLNEVDVEDKLVLIDIDQEADWWINWPAYQAKRKGAKAVIAINTGGYAQFSDETLSVQDICGPSDAPAFSITKKDGERLKGLIQNAETKSIDVKLSADSQVEKDGKAYTVLGEIPGQTEEVLYVIGHYDGYFFAFEDNASGVGAMLGIAKALIDSGYTPEKTIRFVAHPAEEWGLIDSKYDWGIGAYQTIQKHPEWAYDAFALINIDGGVTSNLAEGIDIRSSWEMSSFAMDVGIEVEGNPFYDFTVSCPPSSWTEDFSYSQMGVPVITSGYSGIETQFEEVYHSNMDTKDYFYNEEAFFYAHKLFGTYLISLDQLAVKPLDYVAYFEGMKKTIDLETAENADALLNAIDEAIDIASYLNAQIEESEWTREDARDFNKQLYKIYKYSQDRLITLDWNDNLIFAHERLAGNVSALCEARDVLQRGNGRAALEDFLHLIDLNWYAYEFDKETVQYFTDQVLGPSARNAWGTGYLADNVDLYDVVKSIQQKVESDGVIDYFDEIQMLDQEILSQQKRLKDTVGQMTKDVVSMTKMMTRLLD